MRNLRFFADAQNDVVGVGGFRRPDIRRLLSVICRLNCHNPSTASGPRQIVKSSATLFRNKLYRREITQTFSWSVID